MLCFGEQSLQSVSRNVEQQTDIQSLSHLFKGWEGWIILSSIAKKHQQAVNGLFNKKNLAWVERKLSVEHINYLKIKAPILTF